MGLDIPISDVRRLLQNRRNLSISSESSQTDSSRNSSTPSLNPMGSRGNTSPYLSLNVHKNVIPKPAVVDTICGRIVSSGRAAAGCLAASKADGSGRFQCFPLWTGAGAYIPPIPNLSTTPPIWQDMLIPPISQGMPISPNIPVPRIPQNIPTLRIPSSIPIPPFLQDQLLLSTPQGSRLPVPQSIPIAPIPQNMPQPPIPQGMPVQTYTGTQGMPIQNRPLAMPIQGDKKVITVPARGKRPIIADGSE